MKNSTSTDYATYREILDDLLKPIQSEGLDHDTIKRLYESKLVYLENLRVKCFREINIRSMQTTSKQVESPKKEAFDHKDYELILRAITETKRYIRVQMLQTINTHLSKVKQA